MSSFFTSFPRAIAAMCICVLLVAAAGCGQRTDRGRRMVPGLWQSDIDHLMRRLGERHAGLYRATDRASIGAAIDRLVDSLAVYEDDEVIADLCRILALVGDGHTRIEWPCLDARFRRLPQRWSHRRTQEGCRGSCLISFLRLTQRELR